MTAVRLEKVTLRHGRRTVLDSVSFALPQGAFIGLLGPNGAGKTTLLRALLGLIAPATGTIEVLGAPARPGRPGIGYMPQSRAQAATLNLRGRDFVAAAAGGTRWGLPIPSRAERAAVTQAIATVGADHLADRPVATLSGGERQLLLLALALLQPPRLLLLDEPLVSLDEAAQTRIVDVARVLQHRLGCTILFSTHDLAPVLPALDGVLHLAGGRAEIEGRPGALPLDPAGGRPPRPLFVRERRVVATPRHSQTNGGLGPLAPVGVQGAKPLGLAF